MRPWGMLAVVAVLISACASETTGTGPSCSDVSGNWSVVSNRISGSCDPKIDGDGRSTITLTKQGDTTYAVILPGIEGGCPGRLDATCKLTTTCELRANSSGALIATISAEYTFSGTTFSGTTVNAILAPIPDKTEKACSANYKDVGTKL